MTYNTQTAKDTNQPMGNYEAHSTSPKPENNPHSIYKTMAIAAIVAGAIFVPTVILNANPSVPSSKDKSEMVVVYSNGMNVHFPRECYDRYQTLFNNAHKSRRTHTGTDITDKF